MSRLQSVTILRAAAIGGMAAALSLAQVSDARAAGFQAADAKANSVAGRVSGLDISAYQHKGSPIDWSLLAAEGLRFVGIKVSEGTYYTNPYYRSDARAAARAGLAVLSYVFANPGQAGGAATARFALKAAGSANASLPLVVDLEDNPYGPKNDCYGLRAPAMVAWISAFMGKAEALTGRLPVIYTTADWWKDCTGDTTRFRRAALWLAAFDGTPPTAPAPWANWTFLQYDNQGTLPGIGHTDLDYYKPTANLTTLTTPKKPKKPKPAKPKKTSPKKTSPKKTSPKKTSPKKTSPKKTRPESAPEKQPEPIRSIKRAPRQP